MILVTGGTGLVGSHLLLELAKNGEKVRVIKRRESSLTSVKKLFEKHNSTALFNSIEWVDCEILDVLGLEKAFTRVEYVYHCAATVSFLQKERETMFKTNIEGTANIVNCALKANIKKLCYVSSTAAIGKSLDQSVNTEKTEWQEKGASNYSVSKHLAEQEVWRGSEEGLKVVIVNPSIIIGAGKWGKSSTSLFVNIWKGMPFYTSGINAFVDVRDVVSVMIKLQESSIENERFLVISENLTFKSLFTLIANALGKTPPKVGASKNLLAIAWRFESFRSFMTGSRPVITKETAQSAINKHTFSNAKLTKLLGYQFISIEESVKDTAAVFLKDKQA